MGDVKIRRFEWYGTPKGLLVWAASPTIDSKADEPLGWVPTFDPHLGWALALAAALVRDPEAMATLLEAACPEAVDHVDRILRRRVGDRLTAEKAAEGVFRESMGEPAA